MGYETFDTLFPNAQYFKRPLRVLAFILIVSISFLIGLFSGSAINSTQERTLEESAQETYTKIIPIGHMHDSLTINYTYNGEEIRTYVVIDPDTGKQYLTTDLGGICLREGV